MPNNADFQPVAALPAASIEWYGRTVLLQSGGMSDRAYVCRRNADASYYWYTVMDEGGWGSSSGTPPIGTAGGQVSGTYPASLTVNASHSGSTHAATQAAAEATAAAALSAGLATKADTHSHPYEASGAVATHAGLSDPHPGYRLESVAIAAADVAADVATQAELDAHEADTTSIHGIANTANLVLTNDSRLSDARTPTAHASTHTTGADKIATGTPDGTKYLRDDFSWQTVVATAPEVAQTAMRPTGDITIAAYSAAVVPGTFRIADGKHLRISDGGRFVLL